MKFSHFKGVTLLITHYNRSRSLERLLFSFENLAISFEAIVVSDDCSKPEHKTYLQNLQLKHSFQLLTGPVNKGLGNNLNKGQDAVKTALTLYIQEDFIPAVDFATHFAHALEIMQERPDIDIMRFYAYFNYPYLKEYKHGFSEMLFSFWKLGYKNSTIIVIIPI